MQKKLTRAVVALLSVFGCAVILCALIWLRYSQDRARASAFDLAAAGAIIPGAMLRSLLAGGAHSSFGDWRDATVIIVGSAAFWTLPGMAGIMILSYLRRALRTNRAAG